MPGNHRVAPYITTRSWCKRGLKGTVHPQIILLKGQRKRFAKLVKMLVLYIKINFNQRYIIICVVDQGRVSAEQVAALDPRLYLLQIIPHNLYCDLFR